MRAVELIRKKRDSGELSREELSFSRFRLYAGDIPDIKWQRAHGRWSRG